MGVNFRTQITAWTFLCIVVRVIVADHGLLQDLGLDYLPDVSKINISQEEYSHMMNSYLQRFRSSTSSSDTNAIPRLLTFKSDKKDWRKKNDDTISIRIPFGTIQPNLYVESAELRLLVAPMSNKNRVRVKIYQVLGTRRRRWIQEQDLYLSSVSAKWCDLDVTSAAKAWFSGERNLGLELECRDCNDGLEPLEVTMTALVHTENGRYRRSSFNQYYDESRRTDCKENDKKRRCCRHMMTVTFTKFNLPQFNMIIQPKSYEAGFCRGRCPYNYNHATNHSKIQSLVHRLDQKSTPRVCCAPSKLEPLQILRVSLVDPTKLVVEEWDNMKVLECACS